MSKGGCTVFVGNLAYDVTEEELKTVFGKAGTVQAVRLVFDKDTRQPKGYGFIDYADSEAALNAVKTLNEADCNGRRLRIDLADNMVRGGKGGGKGSSTIMLALPGPDASSRPVTLPSSINLPAPVPPMKPSAPCLPGETLTGDAAGASPEAVMAAISAHTEIAQTIAAMPTTQLQLLLGTMQRISIEAPENARALLQEHPQLCYALLHAQLLLGLTLSPELPPDAAEVQRLRAEAAARPQAVIGKIGHGHGHGPRPSHFMPGLPMNMPGMPGLPGQLSHGMAGMSSFPKSGFLMPQSMGVVGGLLPKAGGLPPPPPAPLFQTMDLT